MGRDTPGFYTYAMIERSKEYPPTIIQQLNVVFKLQDM